MWGLNLITLCTKVDLGGNKSTLATNLKCNQVMSKISFETRKKMTFESLSLGFEGQEFL